MDDEVAHGVNDSARGETLHADDACVVNRRAGGEQSVAPIIRLRTSRRFAAQNDGVFSRVLDDPPGERRESVRRLHGCIIDAISPLPAVSPYTDGVDVDVPVPTIRIGHGYDLHRLEPIAPEGAGRPFVLAGVRFDHPVGPVGHSDGDAVFHAVTDAILGALGRPDIGETCPDDDPRWRGADSAVFIRAAADSMREAGFVIGNIDITVICERPKLRDRKREMIENLAQGLGCEADRVNLKGKTHEGVDAIGEGRAIEVHAVALLVHGNL